MWPRRRYANSIAVCVIGSALLVLCERYVPLSINGIFTSLVYLGTVLAAGLLGGWRSGILATFMATVAALFLFSPPYFSRVVESPVDLLRLVAFTFLGTTLSAVCELLQGAWRRIEDRQRRLEEEIALRQAAQLAEKARADELQTTLASIGDGVVRTDTRGCITLLNPVAERLLGWKLSEAAGKHVTEVFHIVNESTRQPTVNPVLEVLQHGRIVGLANHTILISRDGSERPIDDSAAPIRDASGIVIGCVLVFRDVSERRRSEAALRDSEQRYRAIGESIDYGVWMCDSVGRTIYSSDSFLRLVGLTQNEVADFGWASALHPDDAADTIEAWKACVSKGGRWDREHRFLGVDGKWHSVLARGVPVRNEHGQITSWVGINLDIGRLKQVEAELRDADRRKDEFLATLAHELRNPLAPIGNALQILRVQGASADVARQAQDMMERQVHHLIRLVDDLMDVSRVMRGRIELRPENVLLSTVTARAVETAQPLIESRRHRLEVNLPDQPLELEVDPVRLTQVIANLLTNAAKYSEPDGRIILKAEHVTDHIVFTVKDNGIGIAPHMLSVIFELFTQADSSSTKSQGGLGIGLTLVRNLVELHGGTISVHSEGLGKGSEFSVDLPIRTREVIHADRDVSAGVKDPAPQTFTGLRILVVDDNPDVAGSLAMLLQIKGHTVQAVHSGAEAIEYVTDFLPDLILLDIGMPTMDGYEVARRLRKIPSLEKTTLTALTGWGQMDDRIRTEEAGFDHHLVKPAAPELLEAVLLETQLKTRGH
jgi:PAS domain S-box-containing protein